MPRAQPPRRLGARDRTGRDVVTATIRARTSGVTWSVVGDDVVILDLDGSVYLQLNPSGRTLWERLMESTTEADLVSALVGTFGIERDRAETDVASFLAELRRRNLLDEEAR